MAGIYGPGGIVVGADRPIGVYPITRGSGGGVSWPRLSPSSITTDASTGDVIGTLTVPGGFPRLSPSSTTTDAVSGDLVGMLRI